MSKIVYLNGEYLPEDQATISVMDRGFVFGDGVYEVIPAYGGHLFRLDEHLRRLDNSLRSIRIKNPLNRRQWREMFESLIQKNEAEHHSLYLQITRGVAPRDHAFPHVCKPTVFASASPLKPVPEETLKKGIKAISLEDIRWRFCHIKAIALLPNILLRQQAIDRDAQEAILVRDGEITEGSASNVFIVKHGVIKTPIKSSYLLPGITRDLVLEIAHANEISAEECNISPDELAEADEVWVSSSTKEILPVTVLDDQDVGDGRPGPVWARMISLYQEQKIKLASGDAH